MLNYNFAYKTYKPILFCADTIIFMMVMVQMLFYPQQRDKFPTQDPQFCFLLCPRENLPSCYHHITITKNVAKFSHKFMCPFWMTLLPIYHKRRRYGGSLRNCEINRIAFIKLTQQKHLNKGISFYLDTR